MSAPAAVCEPYRATPSALDALLAHAASLQLAGCTPAAESALLDAITIAPDDPDAYRPLALLQLNAGRDLDAFSTCATMLARSGTGHASALALAADILLFLHIRNAALLSRQREPARLDLAGLGFSEVALMALAPEFLTRARALAQAAVHRAPQNGAAHATLAECELRAGNAHAARVAGDQAVTCTPDAGTLMVRALATYADHRESLAFDYLQSPQLTEFTPTLGTGRLLSARVDGEFSPASMAEDDARHDWTIPYSIHHAGCRHERSLSVRVGPSEARTIVAGRVVGDSFFALDRADRAYVHGVVQDPDVQFSNPRSHDMPTLLARGHNVVLWGGTDRRLLLHTPTVGRDLSGSAFLLASNYSTSPFHWMLDALGRLSARPDVLTDPAMRFVVPRPLTPLQVETLGWLGITLDRVVQVGADEIVGFDELTVVHHRKDGNCSAQSVITWLRDSLTIPQLVPAPLPTQRIYVRRGNSAGLPRILNELDVERVCRDFGYEVIDTGSMTAAEQRDLFSGARQVAGPMGSGLTNLLFTPSGARTVLLAPSGFVVPSCGTMALALGHQLHYVLGTEQQSSQPYPHWDFSVDLTDLRLALACAEGR